VTPASRSGTPPVAVAARKVRQVEQPAARTPPAACEAPPHLFGEGGDQLAQLAHLPACSRKGR
jgi:hypothetical protein